MFNRIKTIARQMFIAGPAIDIRAVFFVVRVDLPWISALGYIMTTPGAANTKPKSEHARASIRPEGHIVYSAKQPNLLATRRCPISCRTKPEETPTTAMRDTVINLHGAKKARKPPERAMPNANARRSAEMTKSFNSLDLIAVLCFSLSCISIAGKCALPKTGR